MSRTGSLPVGMLLATLMLAAPGPLLAVEPPPLLNYQAVLRDAAGAPLTGSYDIFFRFFDAPVGGNEILVDRHGPLVGIRVEVEGGLLSVALGGGQVTDGSGPGVYTSLAPLFRDYADVWLEVAIGAETLAPRTRVESAGYALNASTAESAGRLNGQSSSFYLDTSSTPQTKTGNIMFEAATPGVAVLTAYADPGSPMAMLAQNGTSSCKIGYGTTGIECYAPGVAGFFGDSSVTPIGAYSYLGYGSYGVYAGGSSFGGHFEGTRPTSNGVEGIGPTAGGYFRNINTGAEASLGKGNYGIESVSPIAGRFVQNATNGATAYLGYVGYGVYAYSTNGLYTVDGADGSWSQIGNGAYKVRGSGSVSFVQNHPDEADRVIVYHAPESSEVNVYTRGSARLRNGVAHVDLDPTFAWTANPDIGLTAQITPRGEPALLAVEKVGTRELVVRGPAGSDAAFDYWVTGLRIGFEEMPVVAPKEHESAIPRKAAGDDVYASHPGLRSFNALERHRTMARDTGRPVDPEMKGAADLVRRIGHGRPVADAVQADARAAQAAAATGPQAGPADPVAGSLGSPAEPALRHATAPGDDSGRRPAGETACATEIRHRLTAFFPAGASIEAGDVVVVDAATRGLVRRSDQKGDRAVIGIAVSAAADGMVEVATGSVVEVRADAGYGAIQAGDLLISSPTPGAAMSAATAEPGTILGKALEPLDAGLGMVRVLVTLR